MTRRLVLLLAIAASFAMAACDAVTPAATQPNYGNFKDSGGA